MGQRNGDWRGRFYVLLTALRNLRPSVAISFWFYVFTDLIYQPTSGASGGDRGERRAKGLQSRPLETAFIRGNEGRRAYSLRIRPSAIYAI